MTSSRPQCPSLACGVSVVLLLAAGVAGAQVSANGPQFQVNTYSSGPQGDPAVAIDDSGTILVVWYSFGSSGTDDDSSSVQGQRFRSSGEPLGPEFQVNTYTSDHQGYPGVAPLAGGGFVVVWQSDGSAGGDWDSQSIQARRYGADGAPAGPEFQVNELTTGAQIQAAVAADGQGGFVVAWQSEDVGFRRGIRARRYDAAGAPLGPEFAVNTYTEGPRGSPAVGADAAGGFVVAWGELDATPTDPFGSVRARRYAADGAPLGPEFQVNSSTEGPQDAPAVARGPLGDFIVAWSSVSSNGGPDYQSIQGQRFDPEASPLGGEFEIARDLWAYVSTLGQPSLGREPDGRSVVAWHNFDSLGPDTSGSAVEARRYSADGVPLGDFFPVNSYTTGTQWRPRVALDRDGNFLVVWASVGSFGSDQDFSVQGQRFDALFRDGVESGDTGRWSVTFPAGGR